MRKFLVIILLSGCTLNTVSEPADPAHYIVLENSLDSSSALTNSIFGPALIQGTGTTFASGKWGNGIDCSSSVKTASPRIPADTIPMGDFSIDFWYTKTINFTEGDNATLINTKDPAAGYTNRLTLQIISPWEPGSSEKFYCILFALRLNTTNSNEVMLYYDFGSLEALNNAFPLNSPVHIAITKRNSDGKLKIIINKTQIPASYSEFNAPFSTTNTSNIANKSGYFPYETFIGNQSDSIIDDLPAMGIIDNIRIYKTNEIFYSYK